MRPSRSGLYTILAIFLMGGLFMGGLFYTAYSDIPRAYRESKPGMPKRPLTVMVCNLDWKLTPEKLLPQLHPLKADLLLLQRLSRKDAQTIASQLNLRVDGELQLYYSPTNPGDPAEPGNAIISRYPLFQGRSIPKGSIPRNFGIFAEIVIDGRRFLAASLDLSDGKAASEEYAAFSKAASRLAPMPVIWAGHIAHDNLTASSDSLSLEHSSDWAVLSWQAYPMTGTPYPLLVVQLADPRRAGHAAVNCAPCATALEQCSCPRCRQDTAQELAVTHIF